MNAIQSLPVFPIRQGLLFPYVSLSAAATRPATLAAFEAALAGEEKQLVVLMQRDPSTEEPEEKDLYRVGTLAVIKQMVRPHEGHIEVLLEGLQRVELQALRRKDGHLEGDFRPLPLPADHSAGTEALRRELQELGMRVVMLSGRAGLEDLAGLFSGAGEAEHLVYALAALQLEDPEKAQAVLEADSLPKAMRLLHSQLSREYQVLRLRRQIAEHAQTEISKEQRDYVLRQQLKAIQDELGERDPQEAELKALRARLEKAGLPEEARQECARELSRLEKLPPAAPDYAVIRTRLDLILELPWNTLSPDDLDIARARRILDEDHFGLKDVKERILEQLGVLRLNPAAKAPILCFVGPPGVGKTSLGRSIARAMGRRFERASLGGLHDEAELRGHRRTYIGALPGRILQGIRRAGTRNPLLMLDEVDKLSSGFQGDPAAALLEILDPEQNVSFRDNYLDLPFDLSKVFFITTANSLDNVPQPLLDRMELIRLPGYHNEEKLEIARRYLIPRQLAQTGLDEARCALEAGALELMISRYTREAGVRQLERAIARAYRKTGLKFAENPSQAAVRIGAADLPALLGPTPYFKDALREALSPGVAAGLAWTESGGDVLYVECALLPGAKGLTLTGNLGEVMQESARAAFTHLWSRAADFGFTAGRLHNAGLHLHVPAGAVPKDGPSAGVAMAVAMASLLAGLPARADTAMTGEVTLSGLVLPVGGIKEKALAAHRAGVRRLLLPRQNEQDLAELPEAVRSALSFVLLERVEEALAEAIPGLKRPPVAAPTPSTPPPRVTAP